MDQRSAPEFTLEAFADPSSVRDVLRGILHTIFFLRYFPSIAPSTRDVLGLELTYVPEAEIEALIDNRVATLVRQLETERHQSSNHHSSPFQTSNSSGSGRGSVTVQFLEKKRRKAWYGVRGEDEVCWESWTVKVTVAEPKTESERAKVRRATETTLQSTIMKAATLANAHKEHIPPITTTDSNPFPFQIYVGNPQQQQKEAAVAATVGGWAARMGIHY